MTSIAPIQPQIMPHPLTFVYANVRTATDDLSAAASVLRPAVPMHKLPGEHPTPFVDVIRAKGLATSGLAAIDGAIELKHLYSDKVGAALRSARSEALAGANWLDAKAMAPIDFSTIAAPKFDAAVNWLKVASSLLDLEIGAPFPFPTLR
jgi:hypothetical protein